MNVSRRMIVGALALLLLATVTTVQADQGKTTEKQRFWEEVSFSMQPGPEGCYQIQTPLEGTGVGDNTIKTTTFPNGSRRIVHDREVNGQVVDPSGRSRRFQYTHHAVLTQSADRLVVHVDMTDNFVVVEKGRKNFMEARFYWLWTYTPADPSVLPTVANIAFPPVDNWVQLETGGDPLRCDPI